MLQSLLELLLTALRQTAKRWIVLKRTPSLVERLLTVPVEPLAGVMTLRRRLVWPGHVVASLRLWPRLIVALRPGLMVTLRRLIVLLGPGLVVLRRPRLIAPLR